MDEAHFRMDCKILVVDVWILYTQNITYTWNCANILIHQCLFACLYSVSYIKSVLYSMICHIMSCYRIDDIGQCTEIQLLVLFYCKFYIVEPISNTSVNTEIRDSLDTKCNLCPRIARKRTFNSLYTADQAGLLTPYLSLS